VCAIQEIWTYTEEVFGEDYEIIGQNDCIAVKRAFGRIIPDSFISNSFQFTHSLGSARYPNLKDTDAVILHKAKLKATPYNGRRDSVYGIPTDFDVTSCIIEPKDGLNFMLVNVHVHSAPHRDKIRAKEIREWIIHDCIPRSYEKCAGRIIIAGDFNQDELKYPKMESSHAIQELLSIPNMTDASIDNREPTMNLPVGKTRLDHIFGTCKFSNYQVDQSLTQEDLDKLKKRYKITWWMYLDHKNIYVDFAF